MEEVTITTPATRRGRRPGLPARGRATAKIFGRRGRPQNATTRTRSATCALTDAMVPWRELMDREKKYLDDVEYQLECQDSEAASELPKRSNQKGQTMFASVLPGGPLPPPGVIEMTCPRGHCYHRRFIEIHGRVGATGWDAIRKFLCPSCDQRYSCGSFPRGPIDDDETEIWSLRFRERP